MRQRWDWLGIKSESCLIFRRGTLRYEESFLIDSFSFQVIPRVFDLQGSADPRTYHKHTKPQTLQKRSIQALKRTPIISIPLKRANVQRFCRPHQLLPIDNPIVKIPLLQPRLARRKPRRIEIPRRRSRLAIAVARRARARSTAVIVAKIGGAGGEFAEVVLEQLELFLVEGGDAVAAGDHFGEDREGDLAEFVDVAQQGGVDGVGDEDDYRGRPCGFEVEGDEAFCVWGFLG